MNKNNKMLLSTCLTRWLILAGILFIHLASLNIYASAAEIKRVAIWPLTLNAPGQMDYLRGGIEEMLTSRLTWEDKVVVLDRSQVQKVAERFTGPLDESRARQIGKQLNADILIWGSINVLGSNVSLDLSLLDMTPPQPVKKFFVQAKGMDEVILRTNEISDTINEKVFDRTRTGAPPAAAVGVQPPKPAEPPASAPPSDKTPMSLKGLIINTRSPQIIMSAGGFDMAGVWRSTILPFAIVDLAFGDLDGDGKVETVLISKNRIYICRYLQEKFEIIKEIPGDRWDNYIAVDVGDMNGTGRPQIFVSNCRSDGIKSKVYSWDHGVIMLIAKNIPYHLRIHQMPGRVPVLLGQESYGSDFFGSDISILSWKQDRYVSVEKLKLPDYLNVFNFVFLDDPKGSENILYLNANNRLMVLSGKGKKEYSNRDYLSGESYGGSSNIVISGNIDPAVITPMEEEKNTTYIPARILVTSDLKPNQKEIIINKNKASALNIVARYRSYTSGEIFSLSWDNGIMKENWRTQNIPDYIANYGVADFKNNGQKQLVVGVVQSSGGIPYVKEARSVLYSYDLGGINQPKK